MCASRSSGPALSAWRRHWSRTMECCRRWGIAEEVKQSGSPLDVPRRVAFVTALDGELLHDHDDGTHAERQAAAANTPEVSCTCPQTFFVPILQRHAAAQPSVRLHSRTRLEGLPERRPLAALNVGEAGENARRLSGIPTDPGIHTPGVDGEWLREKVRPPIRHGGFNRELETEGLALGYRYDDAPIVVADGTPVPATGVMTYTQTARPGARAPHVWLAEGRSSLEDFRRGFVLLRLDPTADTAARQAAAATRGAPLQTRDSNPAAARAAWVAYGAGLAFVRPDGHVAWRGDAVPDDALARIDTLRGA